MFVFVPMPGPDGRSSSSQGRSGRVVRSEIFCRLDKSKHTGHDCEPCMRSHNYNFGPHKDGRNHDDVRMEFVCLKSRLHSVSSAQKCIYFELENLLLLVVIELI